MFGSATLDIATGLVLIFLLTSLILTSVQEALQAFFKVRARTLESAILEILQGDEKLRTKLYDHPLVFALHRGVRVGGTAQMPAPGALPSYIPRETFAAALIDLMKDSDKPANPALRRAFDGLERLVGTDVTALRTEVEGWYDAAMDRASGAFKRRSQANLFWLGLAVAVVMNLNAVTLAQYLTVNPQQRELVTAVAQNVLREQAAAQHAAQPAAAPAATPAAGQPDQGASGSTANMVAEDGNQASPAGNAAEAATNAAGPAAPATPAAAPVSNEQVRDLTNQLIEAGLPIGWSAPSRHWIERGFPDGKVAPLQSGFSGAALLAWIMLIAGYFITAFAVMLGAPFWFDVLNKFMVIRGTVKPREKSQDEASEDRGGGGGGTSRRRTR